MAALRTIYVHGMQIEIWSTSFRIVGMSEVVEVGPHLTDLRVQQLVEVIYRSTRDKAERDAEDRVLTHVNQMVESLVRTKKET